jgi:hypothetical protein
MSKSMRRFVALFSLLCVPPLAYAQQNPAEVPGCDLAKNPKVFDGKLIRVRGTLNVYFEDFSLGISNCDTHQGIWLAFGGDVPGVVASMVNDTLRKPGVDIMVNDVPYGIKKDENFRRLYALIAARHGEKPDYSVTATLTGTFFAGEERKLPNGQKDYGGYGHLGCCSLLVITKVSDMESVPPADLYLRGVVIGVDGRPVEGFTVFDDVLGGTPPQRQKTVTNKQGEFTFSNSGQQIRIENPNYRPLALTVEPGGAPIEVRLQDAKQSDWVVPTCGELNSSRRIGFSVLFALPKTMKSSLENDNNDIFIYARGKEAVSAELIISRGPAEMTDAEDSLDFERFEERWIKDRAGDVVGIDAWGRRKRGEYWRSAIFLGHDTASYWLQPGEQPNTSDQVIDSACIAKR